MFRLWIVLFIAFIIYTGFVYTYCDKQSPGETTSNSNVLAGWNTWQAKNCQSCHQIYGLGGYMGPDLTNVASRHTDDNYMRTFIKYGTGKMPNFKLNENEINNLVEFLKWVDKSGNNIVPEENVTWFGNYNLEK